jgi:hypothetical protein
MTQLVAPRCRFDFRQAGLGNWTSQWAAHMEKLAESGGPTLADAREKWAGQRAV